MRQWTDETDREADVFFATLTEREIRRRQEICTAQIREAWRQRNDEALADLHACEEALARSMMARL